MTATLEEPMVDEGTGARTAQEANATLHQRSARRNKRVSDEKEKAAALQIDSLSLKDKQITIRFQKTENNSDNTTILKSKDDPAESFTDAVKALIPIVANGFFYNASERMWQSEKIRISGVHFKYYEDDNVHAGITAVLTLHNERTTTLNLPLTPLQSSNSDVSTYTPEEAEALRNVLAETRMFLGGKRLQGNLFAKLDD